MLRNLDQKTGLLHIICKINLGRQKCDYKVSLKTRLENEIIYLAAKLENNVANLLHAGLLVHFVTESMNITFCLCILLYCN